MPHTEGLSEKFLEKRPAVSYFRVSTRGQANDEKSGLDRQEEAMNEYWIGKYGDQYKIIDKVSDLGVSGAKQGRFDWFVDGLKKGEYEPGTLLLVERVSRFGRMKASQTIEQLQEIWKAGGITAFTDIDGGRPFGSEGLDSDSGLIFELFGAIRQSRREWREKQARSKGAYDKRLKMIQQHADGVHCVYGDFQYKPRTKISKEPGYPFWLNAKENGEWEVLEKHAKWIRQAFELNIQGIGAPTIARRLRAAGHRQHRGGVITTSDVAQILRNRTLLGEWWYTKEWPDENENPIKECVKAAYPAVISPELFKQAEDARAHTGFGRNNPSGTKLKNLFEKRCHCIECGGRVAVRDGRNETKALFCRNKAEGKCDTPNMHYNEEKLLKRIANFRWEEYFGDPKHDAERAAAAADVERLALVVNRAQGVVDNLNKSLDEAVLSGDGKGRAVQAANRLLPEKEADLNKAKLDYRVARNKLDNLRRRRTGAAASKDARKRIAEFMKTGRTDVGQRKELNYWMRDEGLIFLIDLKKQITELGIAIYKDDKLVGVDCRMEDAAAFGIDEESMQNLREYIEIERARS